MKHNLLELFDQIPYFTIEGFKQALEVSENENQRVREMLSRWAERGHVLRLKRGIYMTRRFYQLHRSETGFLPAVSAVITPQSYLSLEYVLQRAQILTEATYPITAITRKNTKTIQNAIGTFSYRHIQEAYYQGFSQHEYHGVLYGLASVAKALFDYLYLRPLPRESRTQKLNLAEDLRLNVEEFSIEEREEFEGYVTMSESAKMAFILRDFQRHTWRP